VPWSAVVVEVAWEIAGNTSAVIEAYRESTISLNYAGDSILNSVPSRPRSSSRSEAIKTWQVGG
jgi:hypothetical protein